MQADDHYGGLMRWSRAYQRRYLSASEEGVRFSKVDPNAGRGQEWEHRVGKVEGPPRRAHDPVGRCQIGTVEDVDHFEKQGQAPVVVSERAIGAEVESRVRG